MIPVAAKNANQQPQWPDGFHIRAASFQPVRVAYVRDVLLERLTIEPAGKRALVVGAGRGLLARELVRLGFAITALDPNPEAARLGRETGARERLAVDYEVGDASRLPYADGSFDVGYWADTLEIAPQLDVMPNNGVTEGKDAVKQLFADLGNYWESFSIVPDEFIESGETVIVLSHGESKGKETGREVKLPWVHIWRFSGGEVTEVLALTDTALAADALGTL